MIRQLFLLLVALVAALWWSRRLFGATARRRPVPGGGAPSAGIRDLGPMVRDRVCNTFLPKSRALRAGSGADEQFFCSEECRQKFRAGKTAHGA
ncbi:MAG TPA: hypothetical protein VD788_14545 [Candidatus Polarisedimenticolaceae bacterium]|nr:hypothetical protein [Candidatus Polarisedimenticolaceae bacterium]